MLMCRINSILLLVQTGISHALGCLCYPICRCTKLGSVIPLTAVTAAALFARVAPAAAPAPAPADPGGVSSAGSGTPLITARRVLLPSGLVVDASAAAPDRLCVSDRTYGCRRVVAPLCPARAICPPRRPCSLSPSAVTLCCYPVTIVLCRWHAPTHAPLVTRSTRTHIGHTSAHGFQIVFKVGVAGGGSSHG